MSLQSLFSVSLFANICTNLHIWDNKISILIVFTRILNNSLEMENARLWQARLAAADPVQPRGMRTRSELGPGTGVRTHADSQRPPRARARRTPGRASPVQPTRRTSSGRRERALELSRAHSRGGELRSRGLCGFKSGRGQSETLCPGRLGAAPGRGQASCTRGAAGRAAGTDAATRTRPLRTETNMPKTSVTRSLAGATAAQRRRLCSQHVLEPGTRRTH